MSGRSASALDPGETPVGCAVDCTEITDGKADRVIEEGDALDIAALGIRVMPGPDALSNSRAGNEKGDDHQDGKTS